MSTKDAKELFRLMVDLPWEPVPKGKGVGLWAKTKAGTWSLRPQESSPGGKTHLLGFESREPDAAVDAAFTAKLGRTRGAGAWRVDELWGAIRKKLAEAALSEALPDIRSRCEV